MATTVSKSNGKCLGQPFLCPSQAHREDMLGKDKQQVMDIAFFAGLGLAISVTMFLIGVFVIPYTILGVAMTFSGGILTYEAYLLLRRCRHVSNALSE